MTRWVHAPMDKQRDKSHRQQKRAARKPPFLIWCFVRLELLDDANLDHTTERRVYVWVIVEVG